VDSNEARTSISFPIDFAKELRLTKGISQIEAANWFEMSQATISAIERGDRAPRVYRDYVMGLALMPNSRKRTTGGEARVGRLIPQSKTRRKS
jgi:DNA-binding XRE family transcriptional regulator